MDCVDVNKLKQDILDSWNNDTHRGCVASRIHWQEHQELMLIVARQPTVDAVPRETIAEIFAEIEKEMGETINRFPFCKIKYAELKKKYTEGEQ